MPADSTPYFPRLLTEGQVRKLAGLFTLMLFLKIAGFFTLSENVAITRVLKVFLRCSMTGGSILFLLYLGWLGHSLRFFFKNKWPGILYGAYLLLGLVSVYWSTNPGYSLLQWFMDLESFVFVIGFLQVHQLMSQSYENWPGLEVFFRKAIHWILCIFLVGLLVDPDKFFRMTHGGEVARLGGLLMNPNELGMLAVVGLGMTLMGMEGGKLKWRLLPALSSGLLALFLTGSRSSMIGLFAVGGLWLWRSGNVRLKIGFGALGLLAIPVIFQVVFLKSDAGNLEEVLSMTGRLPFWKALLTEGLPESPWWGFGFMRIAWTDHFESVHTYAGHMTHNTFIQVLMNLGFMGFLLVLVQMGTAFYSAFKSRDLRRRIFFWSLLIPILINSFTEFGIFGETNYGILFYQFLVFLFSFSCDTRYSTRQLIRYKRITL